MLRVLSLQWKSSEYLSSWKCFEIHNLSPLDKKLCKKFSFAQDSVGTLRVSVSLFSLYTLWGSLSWNMFGNKILQILLVIKIEYFKKWKCSHFFFFLMPSLPSEKAVKYKKSLPKAMCTANTLWLIVRFTPYTSEDVWQWLLTRGTSESRRKLLHNVWPTLNGRLKDFWMLHACAQVLFRYPGDSSAALWSKCKHKACVFGFLLLPPFPSCC